MVFLIDSTAVILGADGVGNGAACEYELLLKTVATRARAATPKSEKILLFITELFYYNAGCNRALSPSHEPISFAIQRAFHTSHRFVAQIRSLSVPRDSYREHYSQIAKKQISWERE